MHLLIGCDFSRGGQGDICFTLIILCPSYILNACTLMHIRPYAGKNLFLHPSLTDISIFLLIIKKQQPIVVRATLLELQIL